MSVLGDKAKVLGLKIAKDVATELVVELLDPAIDTCASLVKKAIPGQVDDVVIDMVIAALRQPMKDELAKLIAQIPVA